MSGSDNFRKRKLEEEYERELLRMRSMEMPRHDNPKTIGEFMKEVVTKVWMEDMKLKVKTEMIALSEQTQWDRYAEIALGIALRDWQPSKSVEFAGKIADEMMALRAESFNPARVSGVDHAAPGQDKTVITAWNKDGPMFDLKSVPLPIINTWAEKPLPASFGMADPYEDKGRERDLVREEKDVDEAISVRVLLPEDIKDEVTTVIHGHFTGKVSEFGIPEWVVDE